MTLRSQLIDIEEQFWTGDADFYRSNLAADSLMVFPPPAGVLDRQATIDSIAAAPRWRDVAIEHPHIVELGSDAAAITYRARARREGAGEEYNALASSVYVKRNGSWKLALHQQTPIAGE